MNTGGCNELSPNNTGVELIATAAFFSIMMAKDLLPEEQNTLAQFFLAVSQNLLSISNIGFNNQDLCKKIEAANNTTNTQNEENIKPIGKKGTKREDEKKDEDF